MTFAKPGDPKSLPQALLEQTRVSCLGVLPHRLCTVLLQWFESKFALTCHSSVFSVQGPLAVFR